MQQKIQVRGAREHNLRNIDVDIPRDKLTVITGLSGSGKSSLAFDTIYAEGHNIEEAVEALAIEARRIRADAIYNVRESDLPGPPRRPGRPGNPNATSPGALAGDYRSERHIRSWRATAILLEPVKPTEREQPPETEKKKKVDSDEK